VLGLVAVPNRGAYIASKFALEGLTGTLRLELSGTSVKVCLIEPGPIISQFRKNALANFSRFIDIDGSRHDAMYKEALLRLNQQGAAMKFTLPESAVVDKVIHALESPRPKIRYYVTTPTYIMGCLKRLLPAFLLDKFVLKFAKA
jgi:short-subunit dehydrogenase